MSKKPLEGVKVVEFGTYVAAPAAARIMADWGADVVKVEPPKGEPWRYMGAPYGLPCTSEENPIFFLYNANKRCVAIDFRTTQGMEVFHRLMKDADVFITNYRPGVLKKMGLTYDVLKEKYPKLVYAMFTGFGEVGPDAQRPGFDAAAYWAKGGAIGTWTPKGEAPFRPSAATGDNPTGIALLAGILTALYRQAKTGEGDKVSASLYGAAIWHNSTGIMASQAHYGIDFVRPLDQPESPLINSYECADGRWLNFGITDYDNFFPLLCNLIGEEDAAKEERYNSFRAARKCMPEIVAIFRRGFAKKSSDQWVSILTENDVNFERIQNFADVEQDEQAWANHFLLEYQFPSGTKAMIPNVPVQFESLGNPDPVNSPGIGGNTLAVLRELGYSEAELQSMQETKIIYQE